MRSRVVAILRQLAKVATVAIDGENLALARARRHEREVTSVRRPRRTFVAAFTKRDLPRLAGRDVQDLDVESRSRLCREGNLVVRRRRPGGAIRVRLRRNLPQSRAIDIHRVDLR